MLLDDIQRDRLYALKLALNDWILGINLTHDCKWVVSGLESHQSVSDCFIIRKGFDMLFGIGLIEDNNYKLIALASRFRCSGIEVQNKALNMNNFNASIELDDGPMQGLMLDELWNVTVITDSPNKIVEALCLIEPYLLEGYLR